MIAGNTITARSLDLMGRRRIHQSRNTPYQENYILYKMAVRSYLECAAGENRFLGKSSGNLSYLQSFPLLGEPEERKNSLLKYIGIMGWDNAMMNVRYEFFSRFFNPRIFQRFFVGLNFSDWIIL